MYHPFNNNEVCVELKSQIFQPFTYFMCLPHGLINLIKKNNCTRIGMDSCGYIHMYMYCSLR